MRDAQLTDFEKELLTKIEHLSYIALSSDGWIKNLISTISGVVLGSFLTIISQRAGKLRCFVESYSIQFFRNITGQVTEVTIEENPTYVTMNISIDFQNTTQTNIGIRNTRLEFHKKGKKTEVYELNDEETRQYNQSSHIVKKLEVINIAPFSVLRKKLSAYFQETHIDYFREGRIVYFVYVNQKNWKKMVKLGISN